MPAHRSARPAGGRKWLYLRVSATIGTVAALVFVGSLLLRSGAAPAAQTTAALARTAHSSGARPLTARARAARSSTPATGRCSLATSGGARRCGRLPAAATPAHTQPGRGPSSTSPAARTPAPQPSRSSASPPSAPAPTSQPTSPSPSQPGGAAADQVLALINQARAQAGLPA